MPSNDTQICTAVVSPRSNTSGLGAVFVREDYLWDNGSTLTYTFLDGSQRQCKKVIDTIPEWTYYANITFDLKERGDDDALIRVSFRNELGDWSLVGQKIKAAKKEGCTMNLASVRDSDTCMPWERSVILHEWGHTLGLLHEHQSMAARKEFTFNVDNIKKYYLRNHPNLDSTFIEKNILKSYLYSDVSNWSEVDIQSIMIYPIDKSFTYEGNIIVGMNTELSEKDKAYMVINYPRDVPHAKAPQWTLSHALTIANVPESCSRGWNTQNVRDEFRNYIQSYWKEIKELRRILVRSGFQPPTLQGSRRIPRAFSCSRRKEIEQFLQVVGDRRKELLSSCLDELYHFLQVQHAKYKGE
ncbi:hypothetical protein Clacol_004591 [Clathrus columnatus]|uniref:Peptidase M12A domain-containing protein n=1 Tax=Clathrus columnatus TaxID=1419009 RepID=A0AAV5A7Y1_9AGAM|nr:hypothetical protein Clacol_004591 [Clathrus columnatus]